MTPALFRTRSALILTATLLVFGACGGDDDTETSQDAATTTTIEVDETTTTEATEPEPDDAEDRLAVDPSATMIGDKLVLLDGFFGIRLPETWGITAATPLRASVSPAGGETELDVDALEQSLVFNPQGDDPRAATMALVHYTHSDSVPSLDIFTTSIVELLSGDGSVIGEPQTVTIGNQDGRLHQVESASGANGLLVTIQAGEEYFFLLSLVSDEAFLSEASEMLTSISMVPEVIT